MGYDSQDEERHGSSTSPGSGPDGDQSASAADESAHGGERSPADRLQRLENDIQRAGRQYPESSLDEVIDAEFVSELKRQVVASSYMWSAPAPSPDTLEAYNQVDPTFADRAMQMAEQSIAASNREKEWLAKGDVDALKRGQYLSFGMFVASVGASLLVYFGGGSELLAGLFLAPPVMQFLGKFVRTVRKEEDDKID